VTLRILIVDDEPIVRRFLTMCLGRQYEVDAADDGQDALERLQASTYALVISDIQMPRLNGLQLAEWITTHQPQTRCLLISGYVDTYADAIARLGVPFLPKPIGAARLKQEVADLLGPDIMDGGLGATPLPGTS